MAFTSLGLATKSQVFFSFKARQSSSIAFCYSTLCDASLYVDGSTTFFSSANAALAYLWFCFRCLVDLRSCGCGLASSLDTSSWRSSGVLWCTPLCQGRKLCNYCSDSPLLVNGIDGSIASELGCLSSAPVSPATFLLFLWKKGLKAPVVVTTTMMLHRRQGSVMHSSGWLWDHNISSWHSGTH